MPERVLILDFGSQVTQLIARRLRELHVYCEIHPCTWTIGKIRDFGARAIILSGGPALLVTRLEAPIAANVSNLRCISACRCSASAMASR